MSLMCDEGNPRASSAYRLRSCVSHTLAHDLRATGNLSSQRLRATVRNPDLGQEAARIELCEHRRRRSCPSSPTLPQSAGPGIRDHDPRHVHSHSVHDGSGIAVASSTT